MLAITNENFVTEVESVLTPVLVDFYADWCGPCRSLKPILEKLEVEFEGKVKFGKVSSDDEFDVCQKFGVRSLPTLALLVNGHKYFKIGAQSADVLRTWITETLASQQTE